MNETEGFVCGAGLDVDLLTGAEIGRALAVTLCTEGQGVAVRGLPLSPLTPLTPLTQSLESEVQC